MLYKADENSTHLDFKWTSKPLLFAMKMSFLLFQTTFIMEANSMNPDQTAPENVGYQSTIADEKADTICHELAGDWLIPGSFLFS